MAYDPPEDSVIMLIGMLFRQMEDATLRYPGAPADVRSSHLRLLSLVPPGGIRLTDWARRASMTKQALGQFATTLEERGQVRTATDPTDARARVARLTPAGHRAVQGAYRRMQAVEDRWRAEVGDADYERFRAVLERLGAWREP